MSSPRVRTGQGPGKLSREAFAARFRARFVDSLYDAERPALARIEEIAWQAYRDGRKAPHTRRAGEEFADPSYDLSVDWLEARRKVRDAAVAQADAAGRSRVLIVAGGARNDDTCPSEMSKTWRLAELARETLLESGDLDADVLDLSLLTSEYGRTIHPCKACVATAMPLCHWPCSCYPNHSLGQVDDAMNEIYERWVRSHGVLLVTPVYWYQAPSPLKLMIDRLVCADGGNPDPTSTHGKKPDEAKAIELAGWSYPKHLAGRVYGVVVHGDVAGVESVLHALCDWLDWMGLVRAGTSAALARYVGYYEPYATSHEALDRDHAFREEARNVARAVARAVGDLRSGRLAVPDRELKSPRPK